MRIYLAFFQTRSSGTGTATWGFWADMLRAALEEAGCTVLESPTVDWASGMAPEKQAELPAWRARNWSIVMEDLVRLQATGGVDLFLSYFFPEQIETAAITEIHRRGIPTVNFFCDNVREFRRIPEAYRPFQLHWVPEFAALAMYRDAALPHLHAPMPVWVPPAQRIAATREDPIATFLGSADPLRADLFAAVADQGVELQIRGRDWMPAGPAPAWKPAPSLARRAVHQIDFIRRHGLAAWGRKFQRRSVVRRSPPASWIGPAVPREEYYRLTRESAVTIGVNRFDSPRLRPGEIAAYSRLRDLEAPMLGACYLTEWAPGLDQLYDLENEIAVYRDAAGLVEQTRALLADPARRARLRRAGQRRALHEHQVARSLERIAATLGLTVPSRP